MIQVTALFELYKYLPKKGREAFKQMINSEQVAIPLEGIAQGLKEVKDIRARKLPLRTFADLKRDFANGE